ncbi:2-aminoadipate transaminase isoform X1 [Nomia melanderi]|uniref:2-aminoadipate transaminase isoform X1 n=3 Tax=Nomia melanderi TaxID=2448451 RepID=UPI003FCE4A86
MLSKHKMETIDDPYLRHLFDGDSIFNVYSNATINLSVGAPGPDLLQNLPKMIEKATNHRLEEERKEGMYYLFQYGPTAGLWEYRHELALFLTRRYCDPVKMENLILTCGATHGLQLLLNTVLSPNGVIFVEEVTYMIALDSFKQFPLMKIVTVPMKNDMVDLDAFEKIVAKEKISGEFLHTEEKIFWAMFYTIPTFHNPTGSTLPPESCKRLVEIARNYSVLVACDDVYNLLYYGNGPPPHRLYYYDDPMDSEYKGGNVISNGSFSKILSPAIRCGWMEGPPRLVKILRSSGILRSGGAVNNYMSGVVASLLHLRIEDEYLDKLVQIYMERLKTVCDTLKRYLPTCCFFQQPEGGYFVWIHLPSGMDGNNFIKWCQTEHKISAIPGVRFSYRETCQNYLRLSIGFHKKEILETASRTLCNALLQYVRNNT